MSNPATGSRVVANFGRLWGRGYEKLGSELRRIISIKGPGATNYLQGLVTSDLNAPPNPPMPEPIGKPEPGVPKQWQSGPETKLEDYGLVTFDEKLRATCFLDNKGKIVTDALLWKTESDQYYIDVPASAADNLLDHLKQYKLRRTNVEIDDMTEDISTHVIFGSLNAEDPPPPEGLVARMDPRHPSLGMRILENPKETAPGFEFSGMMASAYDDMTGNYDLVRRLAGVAEGSEIAGLVAAQANQDFMNAVAFNKGCYLGQELTARVQHTGAVRKRVLPLMLLDKEYDTPHHWRVVSDIQRGRHIGRFTEKELRKLPTRQPRFSPPAASHFILLASGAMIDPEKAKGTESEPLVKMAHELMTVLPKVAVHGTKIVDTNDGKTVAKILSPPVKGTNVVTALCQLDAMALMGNNPWEHFNKVRIGESDRVFRYLPYLPLWWPPLDPETGKAKEMTEEDMQEDDSEDDVSSWEAPEGFYDPSEKAQRDTEEQIEKLKRFQEDGGMSGDSRIDESSSGGKKSIWYGPSVPSEVDFQRKQKELLEKMHQDARDAADQPPTPKEDWFKDSRKDEEVETK